MKYIFFFFNIIILLIKVSKCQENYIRLKYFQHSDRERGRSVSEQTGDNSGKDRDDVITH